MVARLSSNAFKGFLARPHSSCAILGCASLAMRLGPTDASLASASLASSPSDAMFEATPRSPHCPPGSHQGSHSIGRCRYRAPAGEVWGPREESLDDRKGWEHSHASPFEYLVRSARN